MFTKYRDHHSLSESNRRLRPRAVWNAGGYGKTASNLVLEYLLAGFMVGA